MSFTRPPSAPPGIGLGLRWSFLHDAAAEPLPDHLHFFEVAPENYAARGGTIGASFERARRRRPILTHGLSLDLGGHAPLDTAYLDLVRGFVTRVRAPYHTDHLCWTKGAGRSLHDLLPIPPDRAEARRVADRIRRAQDHLGVPLGVENISYYALPPGDLSERDFLCEVLELADCGLLLDVNNIVVNALNHGFDPVAYVDGLPLERVLHLHVAGGEAWDDVPGLIVDTHGADVPDPVVALMQHVVRRLGPVPVLYERDSKIPPLDDLLAEVARLHQAYEAALASAPTLAATAATPPSPPPTPAVAAEPVHASSPVEDPHRLRDAIGRLVLDRDASDCARDPDGALTRRGAAPADGARLPVTARLMVYRDLSRATLTDVLEQFFERARLVRGPRAFDDDLTAWLHGPGPQSPLLRDLPPAFLEWAAAERWTGDTPPHLTDLARFELAHTQCAAAERGPPSDLDPDPAFDLHRPLVFCRSARLLHLDHPVHRPGRDDAACPAPEPTDLLLAQDARGHVRVLELSAPAARVLAGALAGEPPSPLVARWIEADGPTAIPRAEALFIDLAERQILLGTHP